LAVACADTGEREGIRVHVAVAGETMPQSVALDDGTSAVLDPSYVTIVGFALEPCASVAKTLWRAINPLPSAIAHGSSSPTNLAIPVVIAIAGPRAGIDVGTLEPPPDRYCGMNLAIGLADDDAVRLPDQDMVGRSLRVSGEHQGVSFSVSSAASDHAHLTFASPLDLLDPDASATVTLSLDTSDTFDTVDFASVTAAADIMDGIAAGFAVSVQ
jgi:hypothetical protein